MSWIKNSSNEQTAHIHSKRDIWVFHNLLRSLKAALSTLKANEQLQRILPLIRLPFTSSSSLLCLCFLISRWILSVPFLFEPWPSRLGWIDPMLCSALQKTSSNSRRSFSFFTLKGEEQRYPKAFKPKLAAALFSTLPLFPYSQECHTLHWLQGDLVHLESQGASSPT